MWESDVSKQKAKQKPKRKRSWNKYKTKKDIVVYKFTIKPFIGADMPQSPAAVAVRFSNSFLF